MSAARSPSPVPVVRPCCGLRRSADSSPFRTIVSTPDSLQRSASVGKNSGGGGASSEAGKENHHHHPRDAARTPKPDRHSTGGGGARSFMAPTISAASKAVAASASPRKKVLGERNNDPVPSSTGDLLAHAKPRGPPPTEEEALGASPRRLRLSLDGAPAPPPTAAPVASHGARCSLGGEESGEEVENPVSVCKVRHHDESGDAAAPYDPKTNYLSPRPRFLRYRPNPRVEQYRQNCAGGSVRRLADGFASSESSEEADTTTTTEEEDGLSEDEQESSRQASAFDASVDPGAPVAAGVLPPDPSPTPEPEEPTTISPRPTPELEPAATPAPVCAKKKKKRSSLRFLLVAPLALVLFMAAPFVCVPRPPGSPVVLDVSLSKVSDYFLSVQELHPVELAAWLKQWSGSSLDFVTSYWNALVSSQEQEFFGPHIAANLSAAAADDADHDVGFYYSAAETRPMPTEKEPTSASILELEIQDIVSVSDTVAIDNGSDVQEMAALGFGTVEDEPSDDAEMVQESVSETSNVTEELNEYGDGLVVVEEVLNADVAEEFSGSSGEEMGSFNQDLDIPSQSEPEPERIVDDMGVPSLQQEVQTDESEGDHVKKDQRASHFQKLGSNMWSGFFDKFSEPAVAGSILAVLIVSAALAFLYMRQNRGHVSLNPSEPAEQVENQSDSGSSEGHNLAKEGSHLQYPVVEDTERIGGSDASQYSSSLSSGLTRRRKDKGEQSLQNLEPMSRRDSTGYSTSSYGSFTTYEKISAKKKNKEDEAMTPVRRSSRLRNVKSPEV